MSKHLYREVGGYHLAGAGRLLQAFATGEGEAFFSLAYSAWLRRSLAAAAAGGLAPGTWKDGIQGLSRVHFLTPSKVWSGRYRYEVQLCPDAFGAVISLTGCFQSACVQHCPEDRIGEKRLIALQALQLV